MAYINTTPISSDVRVISVTDTTEPVTLAEAKNYLRISIGSTADDTLITGFISAARAYAEKYLAQDILPRNREVHYNFITDPINLYYAPLNLNRDNDGALTNFSVVVSSRGVSRTLIEDEDFELLGIEDPKINIILGIGEDAMITYSTKGGSSPEIKAGILALVYKYYYNDGSPQANWKPFLSPFRRFAYYGVK